MHKIFTKLAVAFAMAATVAAIFALMNPNSRVNFSDNPAFFLAFSETGMVTLDTHQGRIVSKLADVNWTTSSIKLIKVQNLIAEAQREKVAYRKAANGELEVWYDTETGPKKLNNELNAILEKVQTAGNK